MRIMSLAILALLAMLNAAMAQEPSRLVARHEIDQLLSSLGQSGCRFFRNGTWYDAEQAASHLKRKYGYLDRKGLVTSAESLIDLAATKSSISGQPYLVRCPGSTAIPSKAWFTQQLAGIRARDGN